MKKSLAQKAELGLKKERRQLLRVGVLGINHKLAGLKLREAFAKVCHARFSPERSAHPHYSLVLLSTCNRTEVYFSAENLTECHSYLINILRRDLQDIEETFDQKLYSYFDHDCFAHLARVTSGLDSAIVAETEIQGQVKHAYENAAYYTCLPKEVHFLFQKSLKIGKQVRTELPLGRGVPDLEHAILTRGYQIFQQPEKTNILFVGASEINRKIISFLKTKRCESITICNRTPVPEIAKKYQLKLWEWNDLLKWHLFDWVIFGTKFSGYLIGKRDLPKLSTNHKLIIDLCVPRNVEPTLSRHPNVTLLNIDQINRTLSGRKQQMTHLLSSAEHLVHTATKRHIDLFADKERKHALFHVG